MNLDEFSNRVKEQGYSLTRPRKLILKAMLELDTPSTGPQILDVLDSEIDESTVYRNLSLLEKLDIVTCLQLDKKGVHYELKNPNSAHHHHHIVCTECHKIVCLDTCGVSSIVDAISKNTGFKSISHSLELYGICENCSK